MIPSEYGSAAPTWGKSVRKRYETTMRPPSYTFARSSARAGSFGFANRTVSLAPRKMRGCAAPASNGSAARRSADQDHLGFLAELVERELHREQRAERVAVRIFVRGDEEAFVAANRVRDRRQLTRCRLGRVHRSAWSCGPRARPSDRTRMPIGEFSSGVAHVRSAPAG